MTENSAAPGLYVVATPIGNLDDFSPRARAVLSGVALIAAEDTRHSRRLLNRFGIATPLTALHDHNERARTPQLLAELRAGKALALISDAGTPLVSDPGFRLVRGAREQGTPVLAVPGPCAAIAALSIAGLPSDRFAFEGFLPAKSAARQERLQRLADSPYSLIFFVPARRVPDTLGEMAAVFGADRQALLAGELSKLHEHSRLAPLAELRDRLGAETPRGEFVLVVAPAPAPASQDVSPLARRLLTRLLAELPLKRAVAITAELTEDNKNTLYRLALNLKTDRQHDPDTVNPDPAE